MEGAGAKKRPFTLRDALRCSIAVFVVVVFFIILAWSILLLINTLLIMGGLA